MTQVPCALEFRGTVDRAGTPILAVRGFAIASGQLRTLRGPNGSGKSTFLASICGVLPCSSGAMSLYGGGIDFARWRPAAAYRFGLAFVPQSGALIRGLSVRANMRLAGSLARDRSLSHRARMLAMQVDHRLAELWSLDPGALSGGERQMLDLVRAFALRPRTVLLDEPFSALSDAWIELAVAKLIRPALDTGVAIVVVEHRTPPTLSFGTVHHIVKYGRDGVPWLLDGAL